MTGQWPMPQAQAYWQAVQAPYPFYGGAPTAAFGTMPFTPQMSREQELDFLKNQADMLKGQLDQIEVRLRDLEGKGTS